MTHKAISVVAIMLASWPVAAAELAPTSSINDYPTIARADYVVGCMAVNGNTREGLERCSCSVDVIASIIPFADYDRAETVMRMRQGVTGYLGEEFRQANTNDVVRALQEAQAEAEVRCF